MRLGREMQSVEHHDNCRSTMMAMRRTSSPDGGGPASSGNANAPANPTIAPSTTSGSEWAPSTRREMPTTTAARTATGRTLARRRSSSAARPPVTTVAAATWPLGVWISGVPKLCEQARKASLSASIAANVATTATAQAAAPRRQPCASNAMPIARTSGRMTA